MTRSISRLVFFVAVAMLFAAVVHAAPPVVQTIPGTPLKIFIGDDTSYQVLNADIGTLGQIYPGLCTNSVADAGIFTELGGVLYAPNFSEHPCGTATGWLGSYTAWTPVSISGVSGTGTAADPWTVVVVVRAGTTGVELTATYTYVDGDLFFRIRKVFTTTHAAALNVYTGADIYLASDDDGIPYFETVSGSPGGKDCGAGTYTILLIPTTPANHHVASLYDAVWTEIGDQVNLSESIGPVCDDNGAALQWLRNVPAGGSVTITSAVSFGPIPPIAQFNVTSVSPPQACRGAENLTVVINGIGFQNNTTFDFGAGITVTSTTINSSTHATVTLSIASTAPAGPRNVTATQSPGGLTAALGEAFTVNVCEEPCGRILDPRVRCTTDGTGDYLITFTFRNDTNQPVQDLFLTGLSGTATATPNAIHFSTAVPPGGTQSVGPIRIHNASPGLLSMTLNLLNAEREVCCSFEVRFELPDCDCAQIVDASGPSCRPAGGYTYTFAYQSLSTAPLQYLLLTPEIPASAVFNPGVIPLSPPMVYGEIRTFSITLTNVPAGQALCFRITAKTERCEHCCSVRVCIVPPRCIDDWEPYDDTIFHTIDRLTIESASGTPGVSFPLPPDTTRVDLAWEMVAEPLPDGSFLEQRYVGSEGVIASTRTVVRGEDAVLQTRFDAAGATRHRYEFLSEGRVIGVLPDVPTDVEPICGGCEGTDGMSRDSHFTYYPDHLLFDPHNPFLGVRANCEQAGIKPCYYAAYTYDRAFDFSLPGYVSKFFADEVRVWPQDGQGGDVHLTNVEFRAQGPHTITFTDISVTVDCNENGIDDFADIANGTSSDADSNGVPDECQGSGANLDLSLSTGFENGVLAGGSDDHDWRVSNAAAKVVRTPPGAWGAAFANSAWISVRDSATSLPGVSALQFENCFCIGNGASAATLDLDVRADNFATVFLNDRQVSATGGAFNGTPLDVVVTGRVGGEGPFRAGRNCVRIRVDDGGISTGLNVSGSVRAANGACDRAL